MINGYKVIDADAHMQEPLDLWDKYVEPSFYDRRPVIKDHRYRLFFEYEAGELYPAQAAGKDQMGRLRPTEILERQPIKYGEAYEEWWSPESRLRDMKRYGWDRMVCIPGTGAQPLKLENKDPELMWALTRAYHNWAHDFCAADPSKLKMVASIPPYDMENTLIEFRRAVSDLGAVTVMMPKPPNGVFWHHEEFNPFWELAIESGRPHLLPRCSERLPPHGNALPGRPRHPHRPGARHRLPLRKHDFPWTPHLHRRTGKIPQFASFHAGRKRRLGSLLARSLERPRRRASGRLCNRKPEPHDHAALRILQASGLCCLRRR